MVLPEDPQKWRRGSKWGSQQKAHGVPNSKPQPITGSTCMWAYEQRRDLSLCDFTSVSSAPKPHGFGFGVVTIQIQQLCYRWRLINLTHSFLGRGVFARVKLQRVLGSALRERARASSSLGLSGELWRGRMGGWKGRIGTQHLGVSFFALVAFSLVV